MDSLPPPDLGMVRHLRGAARGYAEDRTKVSDPPWSLTASLADPEDPAVVAIVTAVDLARRVERGPLEPWLVRGVLRATSNRVALRRIVVEHLNDPDAEVTGTALRGLSIATIRDQAVAYLRIQPSVKEALEVLGGVPTPEEKRWARRVARHAERVPLKRGRAGYPLDHYRRIALTALDINASGRRDVLNGLVEVESERLGREVPKPTVRDWVSRARAEEFLCPTERGRSQWRPGRLLYVEEGKDD